VEKCLFIQQHHDNYHVGEDVKLRMKLAVSVGDVFIYHLGMVFHVCIQQVFKYLFMLRIVACVALDECPSVFQHVISSYLVVVVPTAILLYIQAMSIVVYLLLVVRQWKMPTLANHLLTVAVWWFPPMYGVCVAVTSFLEIKLARPILWKLLL